MSATAVLVPSVDSTEFLTIPLTALDPLVAEIGILVGLLIRQGEDSLIVNTAWFENPLAAPDPDYPERRSIRTIPVNPDQIQELVAIIENLFGQQSGDALGVPSLGDGRKWHPVNNPSTGEATGFFVVTEEREERVVFALGAMHTFTVGTVLIKPYIYFPLLVMPAENGKTFVLGDVNYPIEIGVVVGNAAGGFGTGEVTFDGLRATATVRFSNNPFDLDLVILNLKLPGQPAADTSVNDLLKTPANEWVATAVYLMVSQIIKAAPTGKTGLFENMANALLGMLGLVGDVPQVDWVGLVNNPSFAGQIFTKWLRSIMGNPPILKDWLEDWYALFHGVPKGDFVSGAGTRHDPFRIPVLTLGQNALAVVLTLGTRVEDQTGDVFLYPGLSVGSTPTAPLTGYPDLTVKIEAEAELIELPLLAGGRVQSPVLFPSFTARATLNNPTSAIRTGTPEQDALIWVASMQAGFTYRLPDPSDQASESPRGIYPMLMMTGVNTPYGSWDSIDLLNFDELIRDAGELLVNLVQQKLDEFFSQASGSTPVAMSKSLAAVLGVTLPPGYTAETWPVKQLLLTGPGGIQGVIESPLGALGGYITRCLMTNNGEGVAAWALMLPNVAVAMGDVNALPRAVTGTGSTSDPWQIELFNDDPAVPAAYLQSWLEDQDNPANPPILHIGIAFIVPIPISVISLGFMLQADLLQLQLPDSEGKGQMAAAWVPMVNAAFEATGAPVGGQPAPLQTPALGGVSVSTDKVSVNGGWRNGGNFYGLVELKQVKLFSSGQLVDNIGDIRFSFTPTSWDTSDLSKFTRLVFDAAGSWLLGYGGRFGLALTTGFGLLPNLPAVFNNEPPEGYPFAFPTGLRLPEAWPVLAVTNEAGGSFFVEPWEALRVQLAAVFGEAATALPMMRLLGWAISGTLPDEPVPLPDGSMRDPWRVVLTGFWDLMPLVWLDGAGSDQRLGFGVGRIMLDQNAGGIRLNIAVRADIAEVLVQSGAKASGAGAPNLPRLSLIGLAENSDPTKPLIDETVTGLRIGKAEFGGRVDSDGLRPVLTLYQSRLQAEDPLMDIGLDASLTPDNLHQILNSLINALMAKLSTQVDEIAGLADLMAVLGDLSIVIKNGERYAVFANSWSAMLSDPTTFLWDRMRLILNNPERLPSFYDHLAGLLGFSSFELPESLAGLPPLLTAFGLMERFEAGYGLRLESWVQLIENPVNYLEAQGKLLLDPADSSLREALVTALNAVVKPIGPVEDQPISIEHGTTITLRIPADKLLRVGNQLALKAALVLNIQNFTLAVRTSLYSEYVSLALNTEAVLDLASVVSQGARIDGLSMRWGMALDGAGLNGVPAPFEPLVFYPLPDQAAVDVYLRELGIQVPILLVSSFATSILNTYVIEEQRWPVIYRIFKDLGLTVANADGEGEHILALAGIFKNPLQWLLSEKSLGNGLGGFDLDKIGTLIHDLPGPEGIVGPAGIELVQDGEHGMKLKGLPFSGTITFSADREAGIQINGTMSQVFSGMVSAANLTPSLEIGAGIAFGTGSGVGANGSITTSFMFDPDGPTDLSLAFAFDTKTGVSLGLKGSLEGTAFPPESGELIYLVPFRGLSQFEAGAMALIKFAANQLTKRYADYKNSGSANPLVIQMVDSTTAVLEFFGITDPDTLLATFNQLIQDPMTWLTTYFNAAKLPEALAQIGGLLTQTFKVPGFSVEGDLLVYTPELAVTWGKLNIKLGDQNGLFGVWIYPTIIQEWVVFEAMTGVGFETPLSNENLVPHFQLEAGLGANQASLPPQIPGSPMVTFGFDVSLTGVDGYLRCYPLGLGTDAATLLVVLLPNPHFAYGDDPGLSVPATEWLLKFTIDFLVPIVTDIILQTQAVANWLNTPLLSQDGAPKPGPMMVDWGLFVVAQEGPPPVYALQSPRIMFQGLSPLEVMEKLFLVVLKAFDGFRILAIGETGGIYIKASADGDFTDYGLLLQIQDIAMTGPNASTQVSIQLGKWLSAQGPNEKNWIVASDPALEGRITLPGLAFYLVRVGSGPEARPTFYPIVELISAGIDFFGPNGKPLINVNGFIVGRIEPRVYLSVAFGDGIQTRVGAAIQCGGMGIPLGPDQIAASTANQNPVAANILTTGEGDTTRDSQSVNPTFSVATGYVYDPENTTKLYLRLFNDDDPSAGGNFIWIPVQRGFGPIACRQIGFGWESEETRLLVGFDGSVSVLGLAMNLIKLKVGVPITTPADFSKYTLDLQGINISYQGGPVAISGGFIKTKSTYEGKEITVYSGQALIQVESLGLSALGSYAMIGQNTPSLFVFALLSVPIGGPPYFFVTGLAAGFGYNRNLQMPSFDQVAQFPFVAGVLDPTYFTGNDAEAALAKLSEVSQPQRGQYWLAAGIKFTTFKMLDSFALLTASFGTEFEVNLLGLSVLELPISVASGSSYTPLARAELQILVSFRPSVGLLAAAASLSGNSYVLDKNCHLTGGFAMFIWFPPSDHSGDFVITLGGYHPNFDPPAWYPQVPRLGFTWKVSGTVTMDGGCYFALTPAAVMAGGNLSVLFHSGDLKAWFDARANFLIRWKPFYYDIEVGVNVGASYRLKVWFVEKTFTVELGATLSIWGPPTGGRARVSWFIISFTVSFGPDRDSKPLLQWKEFDESFLPQGKAVVPNLAAIEREVLGEAATLIRDARVSIDVARGLVSSTIDQETGAVIRWIIDPQSFELITSSVIPATAADVNGVTVPLPQGAATDLGIVPMGVDGLVSKQSILLTRLSEAAQVFELAEEGLFQVEVVLRNMPKAMWDRQNPYPMSKDQTIGNAVVGLRLKAREIPYDSVLPVPIENLQFAAPGISAFYWGNLVPPDQPQYCQYPECRTIDEEMATIMAPEVIARRNGLLAELKAGGYFVRQNVNASLLATSADVIFLAQPILAPLGGVIDSLLQSKAEGGRS